MAISYNTPGVYVEEVSTLPASVAAVATAIPAFVGYTEKGGTEPVRIKSLPEFEEIFGKGPAETYSVVLNPDLSPQSVSVNHKYALHRAVSLYYANGGSICYVKSVNSTPGYPGSPDEGDINDALSAIQKLDEPTLLCVPDTAGLADATEVGGVHKTMLQQCGKTKDRFAILDVFENGAASMAPDSLALRNNVGSSYLSYGAAYYPQLRTTLGMDVKPENITVSGGTTSLSTLLVDSSPLDDYNQLKADLVMLNNLLTANNYTTNFYDFSGYTPDTPDKEIKHKLTELLNMAKDFMLLAHIGGAANTFLTNQEVIDYVRSLTGANGPINTYLGELSVIQADFLAEDPNYAEVVAIAPIIQYSDFDTNAEVFDNPGTDNDSQAFAAFPAASGATFSTPALSSFNDLMGRARSLLAPYLGKLLIHFEDVKRVIEELLSSKLGQLNSSEPKYRAVVNFVKKQGVVVPPSGAVAGVYAQIDSNRGVWKAPANISLAGVIDVTYKLDDEEQGTLNVDPGTNKSINGIRPFSGKGIRVWGARTLDGGSNEWRYINVRRLFINIEESVKKAMDQYVFEGNSAETWVKVKAMIDNFLTNFWRAGALTGAKAEDAFFVSVGLGKTMTEADILEGRMIVEIGIAAVRPAEFIILRFQHKVQEA